MTWLEKYGTQQQHLEGIDMTLIPVFAWRCDWCGGEIEFFPQAKSGLRCKQCWRTEGKK
jgi:hypothetical protein